VTSSTQLGAIMDGPQHPLPFRTADAFLNLQINGAPDSASARSVLNQGPASILSTNNQQRELSVSVPPRARAPVPASTGQAATGRRGRAALLDGSYLAAGRARRIPTLQSPHTPHPLCPLVVAAARLASARNGHLPPPPHRDKLQPRGNCLLPARARPATARGRGRRSCPAPARASRRTPAGS